jgi:NET1-associated nuclear protein 1 (U3 small nucleolar RNA-associated protein 17)
MSHPYHDTFITIHSTVKDSSSSSVTLFRATSPTPLMEYPLPFGTLNIAWFYQTSLPLSSDFSLVALTHRYDVVLLGDNVVLPDDPGASATTLQKGPAAPRRSLFEDMFGVPAITNLSNPNEQTREPVTDLRSGGGVMVPWRSSDTTNFFDAPSHLMPPIDTFFEHLIDSFLRLRTTDDETPVPHAEDGVAEAEDDMPVDPVQETDPVNASVVSREAVLGMFVPLFKEMAGMCICGRCRMLHLSFLSQMVQTMPTDPTKPLPHQRQSTALPKSTPEPSRVLQQKNLSTQISNLSHQINPHHR